MNNNLIVNFKKLSDLTDYLQNMKKTDEHHDIYVSTMSADIVNGEHRLTARKTDGTTLETGILDVSRRSLERRSGCDATGNKLLTDKQFYEIMAQYCKAHKHEVCEALIRDGALLQLESPQYLRYEQADLFDALIKFLNEKYTDKYEFSGGSYQHSLTTASFTLIDALNESYKKAWNDAALNPMLLANTKISLTFRTNDIGTSVAGVITEMSVMGTRMVLGEPISVIHRAGHGSLDDFRKALEDSIVTLQEELAALTKLMAVSINYPEQACIRAIKASGLCGISKKACKDLVEDMLFTGKTSAYMLYLYINGILQTPHGIDLSEDRKMRAINACRKLLSIDWKQFDLPGIVEL